MRLVNTYIGRPIERVEDFRFLRGRGQFIGDINREGQWHAAIVRSSVAFGRIVKIDAAPALAMPGVRTVITAADIGKPIPTIPFRRKNPTIAPYAQPIIAADYVRYVGEPVAVVLAASAELAEDAAQEVVLEIEALTPCVDWQASTAGTPLLFPGTATNIASTFTAQCGDAAAAFAAVVGMTSALSVAQAGDAGAERKTLGASGPPEPSPFVDYDHSWLTGTEFWNAGRAIGWRM